MRRNRLIGIALSCWAALAAVGCSSEKTSDSELSVARQALGLSGTTDRIFPTQYDRGWTNPRNGTRADDNGASATTDGNATQKYFQFDFASVPAGATINSITVEARARRDRLICTPRIQFTVTAGDRTILRSAQMDLSDSFTVLSSVKNDLALTKTALNNVVLSVSYTEDSWCFLSSGSLDWAALKIGYYTCDSTCATCVGPAANQCLTCPMQGTDTFLDCNEKNEDGTCAGDVAVGTCTTCNKVFACTVEQYPKLCDSFTQAQCVDCAYTCEEGKQYATACNSSTHNTNCATLRDCVAGQRQTQAPQQWLNRSCGLCPVGEYSDAINNTESCTSCGDAGDLSDCTDGLGNWVSCNSPILAKAVLEGTGGAGGIIPRPPLPTKPVTGPNSKAACYFTPALYAIGPSSGVTDGGDSVTIIGEHFSTNSERRPIVYFGNAAAQTVSVSADGTTITVLTPAHSMGTVDLYVDNNDRHVYRRSNTLSQAFTFQGAAVPLTVSAISPDSGSIAGGTTVTITGGGFVVGSTGVQFDGVVASNVTVVAPNQLTAVTPAHAKGAVNVVVINGRGGMGTLSNGFTYTDSLPPADIDAGVDDAGTSTGTATGTSATATSTVTATSATNTGTGTATSAVATNTNTVVVTTNTGTGTATSAVATNTGTATVTSATNTGTATATSAVGTGTSTGTKTGATSTVTSINTGVDAGVDAVVVADGGADTKVAVDGGVDGGATDGPVVIPGTDAATPGTDAKIATDGGAGTDAKIVIDGGAGTDAATPVTKKSDDGCSCDMGGSNAHQNGGVILLVLGSVLVAIRRKRARR